MGTYLKWIMMIIILLFFITFGINNSQSITLNYYLGIQDIALPLYGLVLISILLGILAGVIIGITDRLTLKKRLRDLTKENRTLQDEVNRFKDSDQSRFKQEDPTAA